MDIAGLSVGLNQVKLQQQASLSVMKIAMDTAKEKGNMVTELAEAGTKLMEQLVHPISKRVLTLRYDGWVTRCKTLSD